MNRNYCNCFYSIPARWRKLPDDVIRLIMSYMPNKQWFENMIQKSMRKWRDGLFIIEFTDYPRYSVCREINTSPFKVIRVQYNAFGIYSHTIFSYRYHDAEYNLSGSIEWRFHSTWFMYLFRIADQYSTAIAFLGNIVDELKLTWSFHDDLFTCRDDDGVQKQLYIHENADSSYQCKLCSV